MLVIGYLFVGKPLIERLIHCKTVFCACQTLHLLADAIAHFVGPVLPSYLRLEFLDNLAHRRGLEPLASAVTGRRYNQLN